MLQTEELQNTGSAIQPWRGGSACKDVDPQIFFADTSAAKAKQVCAGCGVRAQCRAAADAAGEAFGIWGGLSGTERGWASDGSRIVGEADRLVFVCVCCDAAVSWPMLASPTGAQLGQGHWRIQDESGLVSFLITRADARDVQRGREISCRNGHKVGLTTDFSGLIALDNNAVTQVSMRQRRLHRHVA